MNMMKLLTLSLILGLFFGPTSCTDQPRPEAPGRQPHRWQESFEPGSGDRRRFDGMNGIQRMG
jgi:hypothetical protein